MPPVGGLWQRAFGPRDAMGQTEEDKNWAIAHFGDLDDSGQHMGREPNESQWGQYSRVLASKGASIGGYGGNRPSLAALKSAGSTNPMGYASADAYNLRDIPQTANQQREGRILGEADARASANLELDRRRDQTNFDIGSGQYANRAQAAGDAQRSQARQGERAAAESYFDPTVSARRNDEMARRMDEIRQRYTDPAMIRGQAALEEARIRGMYGVRRELVAGENDATTQGLRNQGNQNVANTRANASVGSAVAAIGGDPKPYLPQQQPADDTVMSMQELNDFAIAQGMPIEDARAIAQAYGYTVR